MDDTKRDGANLLGRREALQVLGVGLTAGSALLTLGATAAAAADAPALSCRTKVELDEAATATRRALQYKEKSTVPDKTCSICIQYEAGKYGECGGCKVLPGAVNPNGNCLSFAPKVAPGAKPGPAAKPAAPAKKT